MARWRWPASASSPSAIGCCRPGRRGAASIDAAFTPLGGYTTEAQLGAGSPLIGKTVAELETLGDDEVRVTTIVRERFRRYTPQRTGCCTRTTSCSSRASRRRSSGWCRGAASSSRSTPKRSGRPREERGAMEAVVMAESPLVHRSPAQLARRERYGLNLLAISRSGERITKRLRSLKLRPGDVVVVQGVGNVLPDALGELRCLPLAERDIALAGSRRAICRQSSSPR